MHQSARKVWALLNRLQRRNALGLLFLMVIGMGMEVLGVGLVIPFLTLLTQPDLVAEFQSLKPLLATLGNPNHQTLVVWAMLGLVLIYLLKTVFLGFLTWRHMQFVYGLQAHLSQRLFQVYLYQPYTFHLQRNSAQLIRNAALEVQIFTNSVLTPGLSLITEGLVVVGLVMLLLIIEPQGALIVTMGLGGAAWGFHHATRSHLVRWGQSRQYHEGMRIQHLQQGLGGAKDVKLLGREADFLAQFQTHSTKSARMHQYRSTLQQLPRLWLEFLAIVALATLVLTLLAQGRQLAAIVPTLGVFAAVAFRVMPSINRVLGSVQTLRFSLPVIETLHQECQVSMPANLPVDSQTNPFRSTLMLDQVTFTYPGATTSALKALSISVYRGESVGIIGPSGAGKSTLVDVILGLLTPDCGRVLVDGVDTKTNLRKWQNQIGYVPQAIFLTDDTLRRNIAFGLPEDEIDDAGVWRGIQAAQLESFIEELPAGLETVVGERGIRLSGGQRQRIGIARALYHDPAILVLDEATSSLDTATERGVMDAVNALHKEKTILIVAHRLSTVADCNRLYRLESGRIVQEGTPENMLPKVQLA